MKYETIDAKQIDDLMARREVRAPVETPLDDNPSADQTPPRVDERSDDTKSTPDDTSSEARQGVEPDSSNQMH